MSDYDFDDDFIDDNDEDENPFELKSDGDDDSDDFEDDFSRPVTPAPAKDDDSDFESESGSEKEPEQDEEEKEETREPEYRPEPVIPKEEDNDIREVMETKELFSRSIKVGTLTQSLKLRITETNQLYSLLIAVFNDAELLMSRNRASLGFSMYEEAEYAKDRNIEYDNGMLNHKKFYDCFDSSSMSEKDQTEIEDYMNFRMKLIEKGLPKIVDAAKKELSDPLVKMHQKLQSQKQRISDLKKANRELEVQTRHTSNRLVQLERENGNKDPRQRKQANSDVLIQQQRLQKALIRVSQLKESNELTFGQNQQLTAELAKNQTTRSSSKMSAGTSKLAKELQDLQASVEQSEDERETAMAQRRVSIARMNRAIEKLELEITTLKQRNDVVDNNLRLMKQGKTRGSPSRAKGSKIPVPKKK